MSSNEIKKDANDPRAAATPVQNPASQPHGTTQDQVNEMESEGQATKEGQSPNPSPPPPGITPVSDESGDDGRLPANSRPTQQRR
jgi:hypothetical protein